MECKTQKLNERLIFADNEISIRQLSKKSHIQLHKYLKSHSGILKSYIEKLLFVLKIMSMKCYETTY